MAFHKHETAIADVYLIKPDVFGDKRGFFMELYNKRASAAIGMDFPFVQDNFSSSSKGTIRGLHFQAPPHAQGKFVTVLQGCVLDVAVDIRKGSPTYGQHVAVELSSDDMSMLYIPPGFAHGFQVLSDSCLFYYKCTGFYHRGSEGGLPWNDPDIGIQWRDLPPTISNKDKQYGAFRDFETPFV